MKLKKRTGSETRVESLGAAVEGKPARRGRLRQMEDAAEAFLQADRQLVDRCLAGEVAAWEEFYAQCHKPLGTAIRIMLGRPHDPNLVAEIAARVWYALVAKDGELLARYSPAYGASADHVHAGLGAG